MIGCPNCGSVEQSRYDLQLSDESLGLHQSIAIGDARRRRLSSSTKGPYETQVSGMGRMAPELMIC